jgi:hypothetical protein
VSTPTRYRDRHQDPEGRHNNGFPTYTWQCAPENLLTKRQLSSRGLRPGGQDPVAQLRWGGRGYAYLYDVTRAKPKFPMTEGRQRTVEAMIRVRCTCKGCGFVADWCLPRKYGRLCPDCSAAEGFAYV